MSSNEEKVEKDGLKSQLSEAMKKVVLTGVGTIFLTEETIRNYLGEFKLPKELMSGFLENASKSKQEFMNAFAKEVANVLSHIDFANEAKKFFENNRMKVTIELSIDSKDKKKET